jgi:two-component system, NtrC family, sensor kinase
MLISPAIFSLILALIVLGAGIMGCAICQAKNILNIIIFRSGRELRNWRILFALMVFFLAGYIFAFYLVVARLFNWLPLLMGTVFFFGALFVCFSVSVYYRTLRQLLITQEENRLAKDKAEAALDQLQQTQMQLIHNEKMLSLGQLVAGIAHEINNPINFIYGNLTPLSQYTEGLLELVELYAQFHPHPASEIVEKMDDLDLEFVKSDLPHLLSSIKMGTGRVQEIVLSLRTFSRLDEAEYKSASLSEGINSTLMILQSRLKAQADRPEIEIVKQYGALPNIDCNPGALNQVFMNLLTNAIDALEESFVQNPTLKPRILIQTLQSGENHVKICIADNGCGMSETVSKRIFDPFFTTKPVGQGTGLGLSISYQIVVDQHQGQLHCFSTPNEGTEFVIQLPT